MIRRLFAWFLSSRESQVSSGNQSPVIRDVSGPVAVSYGVPQAVLDRLTELLNQKDLDIAEKETALREASRRYHELEERLGNDAINSQLAAQSRVLLNKGQFKEAGAKLDALIRKSSADLASHHFSRAELFALQFEPLQALPHYAEAYQLQPDNLEFAFEYAKVLQEQNQYSKALPLYERILPAVRVEARGGNVENLANLASVLSNLGSLYGRLQRSDEAEKAYTESLEISRRLAERDATRRAEVADGLNNIGTLYDETQRMTQSEAAYLESLRIRQELAEENPVANLPAVAILAINLGNLYAHTQQNKKAEGMYSTALKASRWLTERAPQAYLPYLAATLNGLGNVYSNTQRIEKAEQAYTEALKIRRQLANENPESQLPDVASVLFNLGQFYLKLQRVAEADAAYVECFHIFSELWRADPVAHKAQFVQIFRRYYLEVLESPERKADQERFTEENFNVLRALVDSLKEDQASTPSLQ